MAGESEDQRAALRQRGRDIIAGPEGDALLETLGAALKAIEDEQSANSEEGRAAAREAALEARDELSEVLGLAGAIRRKVAAFALDRPAGSDASVTDFNRVVRTAMSGTPAGQLMMRKIVARLLLDDRLLPDSFSGPVVQSLGLAHDGRGGFVGGGGIFDPTKKRGRPKDGGLYATLQVSLVDRFGYTMGLEGFTALDKGFLKRAERAWNSKRAILSKPDQAQVPVVSEGTIRDWCTRVHRAVFEIGKTAGAADKASGREDRDRRIRR